ncbi:MAG: helix-turn-helix domain-containing protein [Anaerolineales bacterium]|nr:helix-turn-helix domain-containing protein [Anaerolineales bacterium]
MKSELFGQLVASVREGGAILHGKRAPARAFVAGGLDVKAIRASLGLSQSQFAALLGVSVRTLRNWELGRRVPRGSAGVLLHVAAAHPEAVLDVVRPLQ